MFLVYLCLLELIFAISHKKYRAYRHIEQITYPYQMKIFGVSYNEKATLIRSCIVMLVLAIIINLIPFIIMKNRKQKSRLLLFFVVPGFSELYTLISILHLNKIIANGIYDMSNPVWNKSFYFN